MAIQKIDEQKCIGCGNCIQSCPADVIRFNSQTKKAWPKYPQECIICCWCIAECPTNAIELTPDKPAPYFTAFG